MNKNFMISGIKTLFRRNYNIVISSDEIDSKLSYQENVNILLEKHVKGNLKCFGTLAAHYYH